MAQVPDHGHKEGAALKYEISSPCITSRPMMHRQATSERIDRTLEDNVVALLDGGLGPAGA